MFVFLPAAGKELSSWLSAYDILDTVFGVCVPPAGGKELSSWLSACDIPDMVFVFFSRLMCWAGCRIQLYRFLVTAFSSTYVMILVSAFVYKRIGF